MSFVNIIRGLHRNQPVSGVFKLERPYKETSNGGMVTVQVDHIAPPFMVPRPRIKVGTEDFYYCDSEGNALDPSTIPENTMALQATPYNSSSTSNSHHMSYEAEYLAKESEEDAVVRIRKTFEMLNTVTKATISGKIRAAIISGPPGIGKSFGVEHVLTTSPQNLMSNMKSMCDNYTIAKGTISGIGLYQLLYENRSAKNVIMFDDCDQVLHDDECLNLLKAALDTGGKRHISWLKKSRHLNEADIPNSFEFQGSVIFLTNVDFKRIRSSKLSDHLSAIMSRCHYLDLEIVTTRDKILRIKQIVSDGMLERYDFSEDEVNDILDFIESNQDHLNELSLRMVVKIADLVSAFPDSWREFAESTCMQREAKYKRLVSEIESNNDTEEEDGVE